MIETSDLQPTVGSAAAEKENLQKTEGNSIKTFLLLLEFSPCCLIGWWQVGHMCSWLISLTMWALFVCPQHGNVSVSAMQQ